MWLQALFTADDLFRALSRVTPARLSLDKHEPDRYLWVSRPERVRVVPGSIVLDARAQISWGVLGLNVPLTLRSVSISLNPVVREIRGEQVLSFRLQVADADLSGVPAFLERTLVDRVNDALRASDTKLAWRFLETLDFKFKLPVIEAQREVSLYARGATAEVTDAGLMLTVEWGLDTELVKPEKAPAPPDVIAEVRASERLPPVGGPRPRRS
jgi:hypothetical protein